MVVEKVKLNKIVTFKRIASNLMVGKVLQISKIGLERTPCVQLACSQNVFNEHFKMFFTEIEKHWALDADSSTKIGDMVLIKKNPEENRPTAMVQFVVDRIVFQYGNIIDPVTKRRAFHDNSEIKTKLQKELIEDIVREPSKDQLSFSEKRKKQRERLLIHKSSKNF